MKKQLTFVAAILVSVASFATVNYENNGGITNDYGWLSKGDMFVAFQQDAAVEDTVTLEKYLASVDPYSGMGKHFEEEGVLTTLLSEQPEKWGWLFQYVLDAHTAQASTDVAVLYLDSIEGHETSWAYSIAAFYVSGQRSVSKTANYRQLGKDVAYIPAWKHAYANPTEPKEAFLLNAPYKAGFTFDGWYATADFSGKKITTVDSTTTGTLYAKWIDYVPTVAEIRQLASATETTIMGVVNFIDGANAYIQDHTGGTMLEVVQGTCKVGDKILAKGTTSTLGGAVVLNNVEILYTEAGELEIEKVLGLTSLVKDSTFKYFGTLIRVEGLSILSYNGEGYPTVSYDTDQALVKIKLDQSLYPVKKKISLTAIAGWNNGFYFIGDPSKVEEAVAGKKDTYKYPVRGEEGKEMTLVNNWVISNIEDNYAANMPGKNDFVRGMAAKDGKMYFINRDKKNITVVDGKTGNMLDPIEIKGEHVFEKMTINENGQEVWSDASTYGYNDIKFDQAGNCVIGQCVSGGQVFQVYVVDLETGNATKIIEERLYDNPDFTDNGYRFDAIGVAGNVLDNGVVMAAETQGTWDVYRWLIEGGEASPAEQMSMLIDPEVDETLAVNSKTGELAAGFGTAAQIFPLDETGTLFYVDGFNTLPMLFDADSWMLADDFIHCEFGTKIGNNEGDTCSMNVGHNGMCEFTVGEESFLVLAATNTAGAIPSTFALYRYNPEKGGKEEGFASLEPLWYFPANGMGTTTNGFRTAMPCVEVEENIAHIYLYVGNNGYAKYTLYTNGEEPEIDNTAIENTITEQIKVKKIIENGQIYIIKNGVKFNVLGSVTK